MFRHWNTWQFSWFPVGAAALGLGLPAAQAGVIAAIAPTCAAVGAPVTITGTGFDSGGLSIAVGGVTATTSALTANTATFTVPAGVALGATTVTAANPNSTGSIAFRVCDLQLPAAWGGQWQMTITYRDATTGNLVETDQITTFLRANELFGLGKAANIGTCTGTASDTHLTVQCSGQGAIAACTVASSVQISVDRTGDTIGGSGSNAVTLTGKCGPLASASQQIAIAGARISQDQNPSGPPLDLLSSFTPFAPMVGGGNAVNLATQVAITSTGFLYSRANRLYSGTLIAKNSGSQAISGPVQIVLTNLTPGVTLANASGMTNGNPFVTAPASTGLPPGQTASVNVQFYNPSNALINFTAVAYSGSF